MGQKLLFRLLALLGFAGVAAGCDTIAVTACEYGTPYAEYTVKGRVTDEKARPLENVKVSVSSSRESVQWDERGVVTSGSGEYLVEFGDFPSNELTVRAVDEGGVYEDAVRHVEIGEDDFEGGSGWNNGHATVTVDIVMSERETAAHE